MRRVCFGISRKDKSRIKRQTKNNNEEVNENANADEADPSGAISVKSSFSNSSIGFQEEEIKNDSERLEEREENNERNLEFDFKGFELSTASESEKEIHINSKSESNNTPPVSPCSEKEAGSSAARSRQQKEPGMDMGEYIERCFANSISKLADLLINGTNMGIVEGRKLLNNKTMDRKVHKICSEYVDMQARQEEFYQKFRLQS